MAQYNADVMLQIGKEAHKFILNRVKCGVISTQHMSDISRYNQEIYNLDQQTVSTCPSVRQPSEGKRLIKAKQKRLETFVFLSKAGAKKSSIGNCF